MSKPLAYYDIVRLGLKALTDLFGFSGLVLKLDQTYILDFIRSNIRKWDLDCLFTITTLRGYFLVTISRFSFEKMKTLQTSLRDIDK